MKVRANQWFIPGSHGGRAPLALLNTSQRKQTIFFHEPVTKSRKRLNSMLSIWQSYGAGHVRMDGSDIVWRDATVKKRRWYLLLTAVEGLLTESPISRV